MTDRVDETCRQWAAERPDLDIGFAGITLRVLVLARHIEREAGAALAEEGLQPWEFDVLGALRRAGPPYRMTPGELARSVMLTCGGMTHRVKRLEERDLVVRERATQDRRSVHVRLTASGRVRVDAAADRRAEVGPRMLAGLDGEERARLEVMLRRLLAYYETPLDETQTSVTSDSGH